MWRSSRGSKVQRLSISEDTISCAVGEEGAEAVGDARHARAILRASVAASQQKGACETDLDALPTRNRIAGEIEIRELHRCTVRERDFAAAGHAAPAAG